MAYEVPFTENGSLLHYVGYCYGDHRDECIDIWDAAKREHVRHTLTWKEPETFHAILMVDRIETARSAGTVWWRSVITGATFPMTIAEFNEVLKEAEWVGPLLVDGAWKPVKRGANFNIERVP